MENIKMRHCKESERDVKCKTCGCNINQCLDMFEICFVGAETNKKAKITLCDDCVDKLFYKTLRAIVKVNGRIKSKQDLAIINGRLGKKYAEMHKNEQPVPSEDKYSNDEEWNNIMNDLEERFGEDD